MQWRCIRAIRRRRRSPSGCSIAQCRRSCPRRTQSSSIPHSRKRPLEARAWYSYQNQTGTTSAGDGTAPTKIARVMDDGSSQFWQSTYNTLGRITSSIDPLGRRTTLSYAANHQDLLEVRQTTGAIERPVGVLRQLHAHRQPHDEHERGGAGDDLHL